MYIPWLLTWSTLWPVLTAIAALFVSIYLIKYLIDEGPVPIRNFNKQHNWQHIKQQSSACYCSICEAMLLTTQSFYCDCCGVCADKACLKMADRDLKCKEISNDVGEETMHHHWIKGNLPTNGECSVCYDDCCSEVGLVDFHCCWCQRNVHTKCKELVDEVCDFGPFKLMIVPPSSVVVTQKSRSMPRRLKLKSVKNPGWENWSPLIVVANKKSGGNDADIVLSAFRAILNPVQVMTVGGRRTPANALHWARLVAPQPCRILVAGGDGTVAWVLNAIKEMGGFMPEPIVSVLPLGTGNDMSRSLGWGAELPDPLCPMEIMRRIQESEVVKLDRWSVDISGHGLRRPRSLLMYNYLSLGVDANVTLDFHKARESKFYVISSRVINKLLYLCYGTQQVMAPSNRGLEQRVELLLDDVLVELPPVESIVLLNITSWGAGVRLWDMGDPDCTSQSYSDGKIEVLGIFSSFHIAQLQVGLSQPLRIGQASKVQIRLLQVTPVQIDGEPWEQVPAVILVAHSGHASVLRDTN